MFFQEANWTVAREVMGVFLAPSGTPTPSCRAGAESELRAFVTDVSSAISCMGVENCVCGGGREGQKHRNKIWLWLGTRKGKIHSPRSSYQSHCFLWHPVSQPQLHSTNLVASQSTPSHLSGTSPHIVIPPNSLGAFFPSLYLPTGPLAAEQR